MFISLIIVCFLETRSYSEAQAVLKLTAQPKLVSTNGTPSASASHALGSPSANVHLPAIASVMCKRRITT